MFIAVKVRSQAQFVTRSGTAIDFSYSSSVLLCQYHSNGASYHTSFRSYRLCRIFATDSVVKRNTALSLSFTHNYTHIYTVSCPMLQFIVRIVSASPVSVLAASLFDCRVFFYFRKTSNVPVGYDGVTQHNRTLWFAEPNYFAAE